MYLGIKEGWQSCAYPPTLATMFIPFVNC